MKKLSYALSHAQMTYAFSMFISSGYEFEDAIQYTLPLIEEKQLKENLKKCLVDLQADMPFEETLANNQIYHGLSLIHILSRVSIVRWNLKEDGGKILVRGTRITSGV